MSYQEWKNQIKPEKKQRNYQHIDNPLDLDDKKVFQKVTSVIDNIKNHQFLPFIKRNEVKVRFRKNEGGEVKRKPKVREIRYASHLDSHIYSYYNFILINKYEEYPLWKCADKSSSNGLSHSTEKSLWRLFNL